MRNSKNLSKMLFAQNNPMAPVSETFRTLRTNIYFSIAAQSKGTILITSALSGEGKSTVAANLGVVMAQAGKRVVIIDCDLRNPVMHKYFNIINNQGLSNLLSHDLVLGDTIHTTGTEGPSLITSGPIPPNPSELLASQKMMDLLQHLSAQFDTVLIDTPPVIAVTDAVVLATRVDGVLLVLKAESTVLDKVKRAKQQLEMANAKIIGVVLNDVKIKRSDYNYYYYNRDYKQAQREADVLLKQAAATKDDNI